MLLKGSARRKLLRIQKKDTEALRKIDDFLWTAERLVKPKTFFSTLQQLKKLQDTSRNSLFGDSKLWFKITHPSDMDLLRINCENYIAISAASRIKLIQNY